MKRITLPLLLCLAVLLAALTGCGGPAGESSAGQSSAGEAAPEEQSFVPVETVEPYPYGGPAALDEEQTEAAALAQGLLSGNLLWELPPFRDYTELESEHGDVLLLLLAAHEGDMIRSGGRVNNPETQPDYDAAEAAQAAAGGRFYKLDAASAVIRSLFGPEAVPDWETLAAAYPGAVLPNTGLVCVRPPEKASAETFALPVGFETVEGGWRFQFAVCVRGQDAETWTDCTSGGALGLPEEDEPMDEFVWRKLPSLGFVSATVLENGDGSFRLTRLEGDCRTGGLAG